MPPDKLEHNHYVNLLSDPRDYHVMLLASMGMSYACISYNTGLSVGQIAYRLRMANGDMPEHKKINAYNYRNGISESSRAVITLASKKVASIINPELRKALVSNGTIDV